MNIAVAQSGGPTCAINASLLGVFNQAVKQDEIDLIYGSINGIEGIINDNLVELNSIIKSQEEIKLICQTPSTVLGSCRYKLPHYNDDKNVYKTIINCFKKYNIGAFFYIGGNDSMDTVAKLSEYVKENNINLIVIGIPKTIDNDLVCTDHTPGFGSAAKYVATTIYEVIRDSSVYNLDSVTIVEIMGRNAGWLTASCCLLRANGEVAPHLIYLPESQISIQKIIDDVKEKQKEHKSVIIAVSEGLRLEGLDTFDCGMPTDEFGHANLAGVGKLLKDIIATSLKCKVRAIELNVMQRCSSHLTSKTDIDEAELVGRYAVKAALSGNTGKMMAFVRKSNTPYTIEVEAVEAKDVANREKLFPKEWINAEQNNICDEALEYFLPLIQGEPKIIMQNGIPMHFIINK